MTEDFDDLDRAIFALPLESPPRGLRASILRATIDAPPAGVPPFTAREAGTLGAVVALAVWFVIATLTDRSFGATLAAAAYAIVATLAQPATLAWMATGGSLAVMLTLSNFAPLPRRSWRNGR